MGLERRKSATFTDPHAGNYSISIFGGTSFRADGSLVMKRGDSGTTSKGASSDAKKTSSKAAASGDSEPEDWHRKACRMMEDLANHRLGGDSTTLVETAAPFFVPWHR